MIEFIDQHGKRILVFIKDISHISDGYGPGCSIYMHNGAVIHTRSLSYNTVLKEIKEKIREEKQYD